MVRRVEGWPKILSGILRERRDLPFEYGKNDCLMLPADVVKAVTGVDPAEKWRGYTTEVQAKEILANHGGMVGLITEAMGSRGHRNIKQAKRGDVVIMKTDQGIMAGVVDDSGVRIAVPLTDQKTLMRFPLEKAWRVWSY